MTPSELSEYLKVAREANCMSLELHIDKDIKFAVTFGPDTLSLGTVPENVPGGWKGPQNLDSDKLFEPEEHVV